MICNRCANNRHKQCKVRNEDKQGKDCDCQHRIRKVKLDVIK